MVGPVVRTRGQVSTTTGPPVVHVWTGAHSAARKLALKARPVIQQVVHWTHLADWRAAIRGPPSFACLSNNKELPALAEGSLLSKCVGAGATYCYPSSWPIFASVALEQPIASRSLLCLAF